MAIIGVPDYSKELAECKCPPLGLVDPKLRIVLKKGTEVSVPNDTNSLGAGAIETIFLFDHTTEEFKYLNSGVNFFKVAGDIVRFPDIPEPSVARCTVGQAEILSTDCGNNPSGIPIYTTAETPDDKGMRVPVAISGNWTPQTITGHILIKKEQEPATIGVSIITVRSQTDCDPNGCGAPAVIAGNANRGGNNPNQLHIFKVSDNFAEIFCCDPASIRVAEIKFTNHNGDVIFSFQSFNAPVVGAQNFIGVLDGTSTACFPTYNGGMWESPIALGTPHPNLSSRLKHIVLFYTSNSGQPRGIKLAVSQEVGAITIGAPNETLRTHNNWTPYNCASNAFPEYPMLAIQETQVGSAGDTGPACTGAATINGRTFTYSGVPSVIYNWYDALAYIRLGNGFEISDSTSFSFNVTAGGTSLSVSGTASLTKTCGTALTLAVSGTFSGYRETSICGDMVNCSNPITGPSGTESGPIQTLMAISFPTSTKRLYLKGRIYGTGACSTYFGGIKYAQLGAGCNIWVEVY